jgi:hypothetical protein
MSSNCSPLLPTRGYIMTERIVLWQTTIYDKDVANMSEDKIKELRLELSRAVYDICWNYGVHN